MGPPVETCRSLRADGECGVDLLVSHSTHEGESDSEVTVQCVRRRCPLSSGREGVPRQGTVGRSEHTTQQRASNRASAHDNTRTRRRNRDAGSREHSLSPCSPLARPSLCSCAPLLRAARRIVPSHAHRRKRRGRADRTGHTRGQERRRDLSAQRAGEEGREDKPAPHTHRSRRRGRGGSNARARRERCGGLQWARRGSGARQRGPLRRRSSRGTTDEHGTEAGRRRAARH